MLWEEEEDNLFHKRSPREAGLRGTDELRVGAEKAMLAKSSVRLNCSLLSFVRRRECLLIAGHTNQFTGLKGMQLICF